MSNLLWVLQDNLYSEYGYQRFIDFIVDHDYNHVFVKPIPFANIIIPVGYNHWDGDVETAPNPIDDENQPIVAFGSITLNKVATKRGWEPGIFTNENFEYDIWKSAFGEQHILNEDATIGTIEALTKLRFDEPVFVRPTKDTKAFAGQVFEGWELSDWLNEVAQIEPSDDTPLHKDTRILISSAKNIEQEYRMFIVNGQVITGSLYKQGDVVKHSELIDDDVYQFTQQMIDEWQPAEAFVIDIARSNGQMKIIEINTINSAGFYAADVTKIVDAIDQMYGSRSG